MLRIHALRAILFAIIGGIIMAIVAAILPKVYEGRAEILVGNDNPQKWGNRPIGITEDVQTILDRGGVQSALTELQIIRGQGVFDTAVVNVAKASSKSNLSEADMLERLYAMYDVVFEKDTSLGSVRARAYDPETASKLANEITGVYNQFRTDRAKRASSDAVAYLTAQVAASQTQAGAASKALEDFKKANGVTEQGADVSKASQKNVQARQLLDLAIADEKSAEREIDSLTAKLASTPRNLPNQNYAQRNPQLDQLRAQITGLESQQTQTEAVVLPGHPEVVRLKAAIAGLKRQLAIEEKKPFYDNSKGSGPNPLYQSLDQQLADAKRRQAGGVAKVASLQSAFDATLAEAAKYPALQTKLVDLQRDADVQNNKLTIVKSELTSLQGRADMQGSPAPVLLVAQANPDPVLPSFPKYIIVGTVGGLCLGLLLSFGVEAVRFRVYNSAQLSELTGVPVAAALPYNPRRDARSMGYYATSRDAALDEALKYMAFSSLSHGDAKFKTVMFTGIGPDVGCSACAMQYAIALSRTGLRVLLVDADLRDGAITKAFNLDNEGGVGEVLERTTLPSETPIIRETIHPNLSVVPTGKSSEKSITSSTTGHINALLEFLGAHADVVVLDTPPCDMFADASRLASLVDEVFLVVGSQKTSIRQVPMARDLLQGAGASSVRVILTQADSNEEVLSVRSMAAAR